MGTPNPGIPNGTPVPGATPMGTPNPGIPNGNPDPGAAQWDPKQRMGMNEHLLAPKNLPIRQINAKFNFLSIFAVKNGPRSLENKLMSNFIEKIVEKQIFFFKKSRASVLG